MGNFVLYMSIPIWNKPIIQPQREATQEIRLCAALQCSGYNKQWLFLYANSLGAS